MKKLIVLMIGIFLITGCGKKDKQETENTENVETNTEITTDTTENDTIALSENEEKLYEEYEKNGEINIFENEEPLTILKIYAKTIEEEKYDLSYNLFKDKEEKTKDDYINSLKNVKEAYLNDLKEALNGKFVEEDKDKGYIEYEISPDHPLALDMIKDNNIWKVSYLPM